MLRADQAFHLVNVLLLFALLGVVASVTGADDHPSPAPAPVEERR